MNKIKTLVAASPLLVALPSVSSAADDQINPWTECGIGAMIFSSTPWAAAISNVIWDLGTTAVTSAGASKQTCEGKEVVAALFINETYANLEEETIKGSGQHLSTVLNVMGCNSTSHADIVSTMRTELGNAIMSSTYIEKNAQEKAQDYYQILQKQTTGTQCQAV